MKTLVLLLAISLTPLRLPYAAIAIATCESGNTVTFGTLDWTARSPTNDGGAFQFNDATWRWLADDKTFDAAQAPAWKQLQMFNKLWNDGRGWRHWKASKKCWDQWLVIEEDRAVPREREHEQTYRTQQVPDTYMEYFAVRVGGTR